MSSFAFLYVRRFYRQFPFPAEHHRRSQRIKKACLGPLKANPRG